MVIRIGVVGTGFGARVVAPVFAATPGCEVVDVVSPRGRAALDALCRRDDLDLVSVHAPPALHVSIATAALATGTAVLCDKPFGRDAADARAIAAAGVAAGRPVFVNLEFRYEPARRHLREVVWSGALGPIEAVAWTHVSSTSRAPMRPYGWLFDRTAGGGWLGAWGSHAVDALRWWFGDLSVEWAELAVRIPVRTDASGREHAVTAEDSFTARLRTATGAPVFIDSTFAAAASVAPRVVVQGRDGVLEVTADRRVVVRRADGGRDEWETPASPERDPHLGAMRRWAAVIRDVLTGAEQPGDPDAAMAADAAMATDGVAMAELLDAIRVASGGGVGQ